MLIFVSGQGRLTVVPAQINQNSNGANTIYLTGAFPSDSVVTVAFTLPDGTNTEPQLMTGDKTVDYNGLTLAVKEYSLPKSITQVYGRVTAQFYIQNGSETLATEATNITIAKGVPSESPSAPENIYEQIVASLSSIQTELTNKLDKVSGQTPFEMLYAKTANGEQTMEAATEDTVGQTLVKRTLAGNVNVNAATEEKHAVNLKQFIDTMSAAIAEAVATKLDKAGGTITGDLTVAGDLTAKGKTFIEEETTLAVKNAIIETNAGKTDLKTLLSGLVINKNPTTAYGFVYDPIDDTVKFGQGSVDENGVFTFKAGEGSSIATRADSSAFTANHLVKWDNTKKRFVDAGVAKTDFATPSYVNAEINQVESEFKKADARLNDNIIRLPNVTYLVVAGNTVTLNGLTNQTVDWGDGVIEQGGTGHNYSDGINVHLIGIKDLNIIPNGFVANSETLRKVYLAPNVNEIGHNAFGSCPSLQEVIITPDSHLAYIGTDAFRESGLTSIVIPIKVATIDTNAFKEVPLEKIISYATTPPALDKDFVFEAQSLTKIIVPKEAINAYKTDDLWSQFANIIVYEVDSSDVPEAVTYYHHFLLIYAGTSASAAEIKVRTYFISSSGDRIESLDDLQTVLGIRVVPFSGYFKDQGIALYNYNSLTKITGLTFVNPSTYSEINVKFADRTDWVFQDTPVKI